MRKFIYIILLKIDYEVNLNFTGDTGTGAFFLMQARC